MSLQPQPRLQTGRFEPGLSFQAFLNGVAEIALEAAGNDAEQALRVTMSQFDGARLRLGRVDVPSAAGARKRVGFGWKTTLLVAHAPAARRAHLLGMRASPPAQRDSGVAALRGLQHVAFRLGVTPSALRYDEEVRRAEREHHRKFGAGRRPLELARSGARHDALGPWPDAIAVAGLAPTIDYRTPAPPLLETLDRCIEVTTILPRETYFNAWAQALDIPVPARTEPWANTLEAVRQRRALRGLETPERTTRDSECPPLPTPVERRARRAKRHSKGDALRSLQVYAERYLTKGKAARQRHYKDCSRGDPDLVGANTIARFGKFEAMCSEAGIG